MGQKIHPVGLRLNITQTHRSEWCFKPRERPSLLLEDKAIREYLFETYKQAEISEIFIRRVTPTRFLSKKENRFIDTFASDYVYIHIYSAKHFLIAPSEQKPKKKRYPNKKGRPKPKSKPRKSHISEPNNISRCESKVKPTSKKKKPELRYIKTHREWMLEHLGEKLQKLNPARGRELKPLIIKVESSPLSSERDGYKTQASSMAYDLIKKLQDRKTYRPAVKQLFKQAEFIPGLRIEVSGRLNGAEIARSEWAKTGRVPLHTLNAKIDYVQRTAKTIYGILGIKIWTFKHSQIELYTPRSDHEDKFLRHYMRHYVELKKVCHRQHLQRLQQAKKEAAGLKKLS